MSIIPELEHVSLHATVICNRYSGCPAMLDSIFLLDSKNQIIQVVCDFSDFVVTIREVLRGVLSYDSVVRIGLSYHIDVSVYGVSIRMTGGTLFQIEKMSIDTALCTINVPDIPKHQRPKASPPLPSVIADTIESKDIEEVKRSLLSGYDVNACGPRSLLNLAVMVKSDSILDLLLKCDGIRVDMIDVSRQSPLESAVKSLNPYAVTSLLKARASVTIQASEPGYGHLHRLWHLFYKKDRVPALANIIKLLLDAGLTDELFIPDDHKFIPRERWNKTQWKHDIVPIIELAEDGFVDRLINELTPFVVISPIVWIITEYTLPGLRTKKKEKS